MIDAYLDESGIHDKAKVCVIAGYFGSLGPMKKLEREWKATLKHHSFPMKDFHAKSMIKTKKHFPILRDLVRVIAEQKRVYPVSFGLVVDDFESLSLKERKFLTGAIIHPKTKRFMTSGCPSKPYFIPFQQIIKIVTDHTPTGDQAHFFFGLDREFAEYALQLFRQIDAGTAAKRPTYSTWKSRKRLGSSSFPLAAETPQLQAADLLTHLTYLHMNRILFHEQVSHRYPELLAPCLTNTRKALHHVYQNRHPLKRTLALVPAYVAGWDK
jgi:hypothetical protein